MQTVFNKQYKVLKGIFQTTKHYQNKNTIEMLSIKYASTGSRTQNSCLEVINVNRCTTAICEVSQNLSYIKSCII